MNKGDLNFFLDDFGCAFDYLKKFAANISSKTFGDFYSYI